MLNKDQNSNELPEQILRNLVAKHFTGENEVILDKLLGQLSFSAVEEFLHSRFPGIEHVNIENFNPDIAKQLNFDEIADHFGPSIKTDWFDGFSKEQLTEFDKVVSSFTKELLHDVVFPILAIENQDAAAKVQDFLKQILSSLKEVNDDAAEFCENLDIENVPLRSSLELFLAHGAKFPGFPKSPEVVKDTPIEYDEEEIGPETKDAPGQLLCELTENQVVYLAYILQTDYGVLKKLKPIVTLLKSPCSRYVSVVVSSDRKKLGLLLSVIKCLYEKKTPVLGDRYLRTDKGNGIWEFFQCYLVEEPDNNYYDRELRKLFSENKNMEKAQEIIDSVLNPNNQNKISQTVIDITKNKTE